MRGVIILTNEERILALLERQEKTLENHGKMLEEHGKMLEEQGKMLADHSKMLERLKVDVSGIKVRLDVEVEKKLQLLTEGHQTLLDTLAPKSRVENLEDEMAFLRSIIKTMNEDISTLKKAQ